MANTYTSTYNLVKPEVGADTNAWGGHLNSNLDTIDSNMLSRSLLTAQTMAGAVSFPSNGINVGAGQLQVSGGNVSASGNFSSVNGSFSGTLSVTGTSAHTGNATFGGTLAVTGGVTLSSTLAVTGATTLAANGLNVGSGQLQVTGGNVTASGNITATGSVNAASGTITGNLSVATPTLTGHAATKGYVDTNYQPLDSDLTAIAALSTNGFAKRTGVGTWVIDGNTYLTGNQTVTVSGDVSGSGATAITATLATVNANVGSFGSGTAIPVITVNGKGLTTAVSTTALTPAWSNVTGTPTTLAGYGITNALALTGGTLTGNLSVINSTTEMTLTLGSSGGYYYGNATDAGWKNSGGTARVSWNISTGDFTAAGNVTAYSDARLKENVKTIQNAVDLVNQMRGVYYDRIDTGEAGVGVIAQEMREVIPEIVVENDGMLSVAYGNLVGVLIEAVKELNAKIEKLEAQ